MAASGDVPIGQDGMVERGDGIMPGDPAGSVGLGLACLNRPSGPSYNASDHAGRLDSPVSARLGASARSARGTFPVPPHPDPPKRGRSYTACPRPATGSRSYSTNSDTRATSPMVTELNKVIIGQRELIELILAAIFTRGHVLLVGVPGLAKTLMVSSIARILDVGFKRIQFTPDLMPSDITGTNVLEEPEAGRRSFRFVAGPLFANIILADEINRTPPKTQAALLQAMQEREVTVGQETMHLPDPFFVIATQNPIEQEGTYPLPEAQLDRFMFDVRVEATRPSRRRRRRSCSRTTKGDIPDLKKVLSGKAIVNLQKLVTSVPVSEYTVDYVTRLVRATRPADPASPQFIKELVDYGRTARELAQGPDPLRQGDGRDGRAVPARSRSTTSARWPRPGAAAPGQRELPGSGRGAVEPTRSSSGWSARSRSPSRRSTSARADEPARPDVRPFSPARGGPLHGDPSTRPPARSARPRAADHGRGIRRGRIRRIVEIRARAGEIDRHAA